MGRLEEPGAENVERDGHDDAVAAPKRVRFYKTGGTLPPATP